MSEKKQLNEKDLKEVAGGQTGGSSVHVIGWYHTKNNCYGRILNVGALTFEHCKCDKCGFDDYYSKNFDRVRVTKVQYDKYVMDYFKAGSGDIDHSETSETRPSFAY